MDLPLHLWSSIHKTSIYVSVGLIAETSVRHAAVYAIAWRVATVKMGESVMAHGRIEATLHPTVLCQSVTSLDTEKWQMSRCYQNIDNYASII
jgi:hypothetical protein